MDCPHSVNEIDAARIDGLCPLCLKAEVERLKERYIEAVNDIAQMKRNVKKCKCSNCGFGLDQALKEVK